MDDLIEQFQTLPGFDVSARPGVFLGHDPDDDYMRVWTTDVRHSVGVIAPPGYGKTSGVIIPAVLSWAGPVVSTSTRGDILQATGDWRARLAAEHGGRVYVYDPLGSEPGVVTLRWSPTAGCADPRVAYRRVASMTAGAGKGVRDADHWRSGAARILRAYFHAAALHGRTLTDVYGWVASRDTEEAARLIFESTSPARVWAHQLRSVDRLGPDERGGFYSMAEECLDAYADPQVLNTADASELDIDEFLSTWSTLYIVGPPAFQEATAPLIVGLVESITERAMELAAAAGGRLPSALLVALDEVANTAPIRSLSTLVSAGGGYGMTCVWSVQDLAQLRERYGADGAAAILSASGAKLIFGGWGTGDDLRSISAWAGERRTPQVTVYSGTGADEWKYSPTARPGGVTDPHRAGREHAVGYIYRPRLPVDEIRGLPRFHAWLFHGSDQPLLVVTPPAGLVPSYENVLGWTRAVSP